MRYAIYFTLPMNEPLARVAANWLGRDPFSGAAVPVPAIGNLSAGEIAEITAFPRRYGFHATLKPPFRLRSEDLRPDLLAEMMHFATDLAPFELPPLVITRLGKFFALTPSEPSEALQALVDEAVVRFDAFRAPLTEAERARRHPEKLSERQLSYLDRWGYPYIFEEFRFHMTLTGPVDDRDAARVRHALDAFFEPALNEPVDFSNIALFVEEEAGGPFLVDSLHPLGRIDEGAPSLRTRQA